VTWFQLGVGILRYLTKPILAVQALLRVFSILAKTEPGTMHESSSELLMTLISQFWSTALIDFILTFLAMYPLIGFLLYGWRLRADEISKLLSPKAKQHYLDIFQKNHVEESLAIDEFNKFYRERYGLRFFIIPILFLFIVLIVANFFIAQTLEDLTGPAKTSSQFSTAAAALAGAYTFVSWDLFARMQRRNLSRADILRSTLRLLVSIPLGFAFSALLNANLAPFIAFAIGAFPLQEINTILQRLARQRLELPTPESSNESRVVVLFGIDNSIAERIEDADITTVAQLAWCDPIQLTMRSNLQFGYVIDIMSQALAWVYFESKLKTLSTVGLRGAIEIRTMLRRIAGDDLKGGGRSAAKLLRKHDKDPLEKAAAISALKNAATIAKVDSLALTSAFLEIAKDPFTEFLDTCWKSFTARPGS
jgi:hypothetical protein